MQMAQAMRPATIAVAHQHSVAAMRLQSADVRAAVPTAAVLREVALQVPVLPVAVLRVLAHAL